MAKSKTICKNCGKEFMARNAELKGGRAKFCSHSCHGFYKGFQKGEKAWNSGKKVPQMTGENHPRWKGFEIRECLQCKKEFKVFNYRIKDKERGRFCSRSCVAKYHNGELASNWRGGIYDTNQKIRSCREYKLWREAVLERDNYTCIWCGSKEKLNTDHIKPFAYYPELRFAIDNGRVLCINCHRKTNTYGNVKYEKS